MKINKMLSKMLSVCLVLTLFILPLSTVLAEDNAGEGGGGTGGTVNQGDVDLWNDNKQGYRITILSEDGSRVICSSKDFVFSKPNAKNLKKSSTNKFGNSQTNGNWETIISNMPKAIKVVGNNYLANGEELKSWLTKGGALGKGEIGRLIADNFGGVTLWNECVKENHKILIEPIIWYEPRLSGTGAKVPPGIGYTVYGTVTNIAQHNKALSSKLGNENGGYDQSVSNAAAPSSLVTILADNALGVTNAGKDVKPNGVPSKGIYSCGQITDTTVGLGLHIYSRDSSTIDPPVDPPIPPAGVDEVGKYRYDFSCDKLTILTNPIREENDFNASTTFSYQQEIDCKHCVTNCPLCNLTGKHQVKVADGYMTHNANCDVFISKPCSCGGYWVSPVYETHLCDKCYINCTHCDLGKLWYKKGSEYPTPTKSTTVEVFVKDATLDYKKGISGVLKYTKAVTLSADNNISVDALLNAGEDVGIKSVVSRINWETRNTEYIADNNSLATAINVIPATNLQIEYVIPNAGFRTGTDVISSFLVLNQNNIGALNVRPKHNLDAVFKAINPDTKEVIATSVVNQIVVPKGGTNSVYFKWSVPNDYSADNVHLQCEINTSQSVNEMSFSDNTSTGINNIDKFKEQIPPDTVFENKPSRFVKPSGLEPTPTKHITTSVVSGINYQCWEWASDYVKRNYIINLSASYEYKPNDKSPSHEFLASNEWQMRSGYGVELNITANLSGNLPTEKAYTTVQNGNAYLPEYRFKLNNNNYRTLEQTSPNVLNFPKNPYTTTDKGKQDFKRVHFSPLWYPDGDYKMKTYIYDVWTPIGMLSTTQDVLPIKIKGDMYDDWYLSHAKKPKE